MIDPYDYPILPPAQDVAINSEVSKIVSEVVGRGIRRAVGYVPPMVDREIDMLAKIHCWEFYDSFEMDCE